MNDKTGEQVAVEADCLTRNMHVDGTRESTRSGRYDHYSKSMLLERPEFVFDLTPR